MFGIMVNAQSIIAIIILIIILRHILVETILMSTGSLFLTEAKNAP